MGTVGSLEAAVFVSVDGSFTGLESLIEGFFSSAKHLCKNNPSQTFVVFIVLSKVGFFPV